MEQSRKEYQKVIEYIRNQIASNKLSIGSKLPTERELAEHLSISRNSTREAIRTMENMGMLESQQGSGNYLCGNMEKPISGMIDMMLLLHQTSKSEICSFRRSLDQVICSSLLRTPFEEDTLNQIKEALDYGEKAITREQLSEADRLFHYSLINATQNQLWISISNAIITIYREWIDEVIEKSDSKTMEALANSHRQIFLSTQNNDPASCKKWIDHHYDIVDSRI